MGSGPGWELDGVGGGIVGAVLPPARVSPGWNQETFGRAHRVARTAQEVSGILCSAAL